MWHVANDTHVCHVIMSRSDVVVYVHKANKKKFLAITSLSHHRFMVPYPCLDCLLGLYAETFMCSPSTWQGQTACQLSASHLYASYSYANTYFPWAYHYMRPEWGLGVLRVNMWKYCVLTPKRHYPAWIRVCCCIAWQNRFNGLSSRSLERFLRTKK